jgi:hypothetical protein
VALVVAVALGILVVSVVTPRAVLQPYRRRSSRDTSNPVLVSIPIR